MAIVPNIEYTNLLLDKMQGNKIRFNSLFNKH